VTGATDGPPPEPLEHHLVERSRQQDEQAFAELVRRHQTQLFRVALRMTNDRQAAEDIVQDALVQAWQHLAGFRADARFSTWATRIVINRCLNARRGANPSTSLEGPAVAPQLPTAPSAEQEALRRQREEAVRRAVASLPFDQRAALVLTAFSGHSYAEVARILGIGESTAKVRAHRARRALAERLREWR
jgi:RNA polymerase sigma-70 factor (ECF subfamily)